MVQQDLSESSVTTSELKAMPKNRTPNWARRCANSSDGMVMPRLNRAKASTERGGITGIMVETEIESIGRKDLGRGQEGITNADVTNRILAAGSEDLEVDTVLKDFGEEIEFAIEAAHRIVGETTETIVTDEKTVTGEDDATN